MDIANCKLNSIKQQHLFLFNRLYFNLSGDYCVGTERSMLKQGKFTNFQNKNIKYHSEEAKWKGINHIKFLKNISHIQYPEIRK